MDDLTKRQWSEWVDNQIGGDDWRRRTALEAALLSLQAGHSANEAAAAAKAAVGGPPPPPGIPYQPTVVRCRFCGSTPAVPMTIYEHNGFIILMQFRHLKGPFCRGCGLNAWRRMTNTTLLRGWLGFISFFAAPVTALVNVVNLPRLNNLPPPNPSQIGRPPADPGSGMLKRPGVYVYAGVLVVAVVFFLLPALVH